MLPAAAVLDLLISAASLGMRGGSPSDTLVLSSTVFAAPVLLGESASQLVQCSVEMPTGTALLSTPHSAGSPDARQIFAHASIIGQGDSRQTFTVALQHPRLGPAKIAVRAQLAMARPLRPRFAAAVPGTHADGTLVPVAPLDCTLQLAAISSGGRNAAPQSHTVLVPSELQACKTSFIVPPALACPSAYWAAATRDAVFGSNSHQLSAADGELAAATALAGVHFKPFRLMADARSASKTIGLHGAPDVLFELCQIVVSPDDIATEGPAPTSQARLQLRQRWPTSAASAALMVLQTGGAPTQHAAAAVPAMHFKSGSEAVRALLQTARLEQPRLGAISTGATLPMCYSHMPCICLQPLAQHQTPK